MDQTNKIFYIEFQAPDLGKTRAFFETVFGWTFTDYGPDYTSFADGRIAGGFFRSDKFATAAAGSALVVIQHPQLEETLKRVVDHGGRRFHFTEPGGNELSVCADEGAAP